jgi:enoyl-CoA hydratase
MIGNQLVRYEKEGFIGEIVLNRPEKRNALNLSLWCDLERAVSQAEEDMEARVFLVRGEGGSFSAGLDLSPDNELFDILKAPVNAASKTAFYREVRKIQDIYTRLERLTRPTIAVIQGHCLGGALELALCCDIRLAEKATVFGLPEARLAIITDVGGLQRLPRVVGPAKAREMAFRAHRFSASGALKIGLVNEVYETMEQLKDGAVVIAGEIARNAPLAVQGAKEVFLSQETNGVDLSLAYNAARSSMIMPSADLFEAVAAYMQKREPRFKGE